MPRRILAILALSVALATVVTACGGGGGGSADGSANAPAAASSTAPFPGFVVVYNPYAEVDFAQTPRLLAQHHDHAGVSQAKLLSYDEAGYNVLSLQDYSGNPRLAYAWTTRRWPPDKWLPKDFTARLRNLEMFLPNAEEVGISELHVTSTFMQKYIEAVPDGQPAAESHQYKTITEMLNLVKSGGGVPCLAHPFEPLLDTNYWSKLAVPCLEIYSAFAEGSKEQGQAYFTTQDRNAIMRANWDRLLRENRRTLGIAVNDHFGPDTPRFVKVSEESRDSGKLLVFAPAATLQSYEDAFRRGAFLAVVDRGKVKGNFPEIREISVQGNNIYIDTDATVQWFTNFGKVASGNVLMQTDVRRGTTYARAEISNADGSIVYTQAFSIDVLGELNPDDRADCLRMAQPLDGPAQLPERCASR